MEVCWAVRFAKVMLGITLSVLLGGVSYSETTTDSVDFNSQVRPILTKHCTACHGGVQVAAGISFAYKDDLLSVIDPGDPDDSYFLERIVTDDDSYRMPPKEHGPRLSKNEIEVLRKWVAQGANWSKHWAYQLPQRHEMPMVSNPQWPRQPLDYFVLRKLDELGVEPSEQAEASRWLRRVSLDLVGIPPTPEQLLAFQTDIAADADAAYESAVDRLLASERFGERWASVWFDLVRYADSRGLSEDSPRDIWKYRDWVIDAFNADMPFDSFTKKQISGDLMPNGSLEDRLATAVHRLTASNEEGGTDDEEFRVAAVLDRVDTIWQTWQGTTMGCVQCHDHPYEPISHDEFYRFMAYFNNTADCDLDNDWPTLAIPLDEGKYAQATQLDQEIEKLRENLWQRDWQVAHLEPEWYAAGISNAKTSNATKLTIEHINGQDRYRTVGTVARNPVITVRLSVPEGLSEVTGIRLTALPLDEEKALKDAEVGFVMSEIDVAVTSGEKGQSEEVALSAVIGDEPFPYSSPTKSLKDSNEGFGAYTRIHHPRHLVLIPETPIKVNPQSEVVIKIRYGVFNLAAFSLVARSGQFDVTSDARLTELLKNEQRHADQKRLSKLQKDRKAIASIDTPVLVQRPSHLARPSHRFDRGLFLTKAEEVQPGVPKVLNSHGQDLPDRLLMAEWLVSDQNPLTARVMVNRLWARMFEIGLVPTEGDFGAAGDMPSHPELLDDLAVRFREDYQWSIKSLLREFALSSTYRQSSRVTDDFDRKDPQNRLLARGPRRTLPAETIRDQMLFVSGLLNQEMEGTPVYPPIPNGVWRARRGSWKEHKVGDPNRYRRSVYTYVKRSVPFPMQATFDAPGRDVCTTQRLRSNTPLQALMLLNDEAADECAAALADRMKELSNDLEEQVQYGFLQSTCRMPREDELARLIKLYHDTAADSNEGSALQAVAAVLLNLDEVLNN